jgi:hypothetical protein
MADSYILIFLSFVGIALIAGLLALRAKTGNRFEIKPLDIIIAIIPVLAFFVASGKLEKAIIPGILEIDVTDIVPQKLTFSETGVTVDKSWEQGGIFMSFSPEESMEKNIMECPMKDISYTEKFIETYFKFFPALRYVFITDREGDFVGIYEAQKLYLYLFPKGDIYEPKDNEYYRQKIKYEEEKKRWLHDFAKALNDGNVDYLRGLKGFVSKREAIRSTHDVKEAFVRMERTGSDFLPVIDEKNRLEGVVERSEVLATLLSDIMKSIEK